MTDKVPAKAWLHLGVVGMDRAPGSARRGLLGRKVGPLSPGELEGELVTCATAYRRGCLGMFLGLLVLPLVPLAASQWVSFLHYANQRGLSGTAAHFGSIAGDVVLAVLWLAVYLWMALVPALKGVTPYGRVAGAVAALEDMPNGDRAAWVDEYRAEEHPASDVLVKRSRPFREIVEMRPVRG
jgi:hypothetical protein